MWISPAELTKLAKKALRGVGEPLRGQWIERGERAMHVRRRLSRAEQMHVGDVRDLRQTEEGWTRLRAVVDVIPPQARQGALEEIQEIPR